MFLEGSCIYSQIILESHQGHHGKSTQREVTIPHLKSNGSSSKVSGWYPEYYGFFAWLQNALSELHVLERLGDSLESKCLAT